MTLSAFLYFGAVTGLAFAALRGPRPTGILYVFLLPWYGLIVDIGLNISPDRVVAVVLAAMALASKPGAANRNIFIPFLVFMWADTIVHSAFGLPSRAAFYPPLRGEYRWVVQLIVWTLGLLAASLFAQSRMESVSRRVPLVLSWSITTLAGLGILQWSVFRLTGIDLFPIGFLGPEEQLRSAMVGEEWYSSALGQFRASSLGGEPKHLAASIAIGVAILGLNLASGGSFGLSPRVMAFQAVVQLGALPLTQSTQGLFLTILNIGLVGAVLLFSRDSARGRGLVPAAATLLGIAAILRVLLPGVEAQLLERSVGRISSEGALEDYNITILNWLASEPRYLAFGAGLGNVHLFAFDYVPHENQFYMDTLAFTAKSGLLRIVSELGIVGLAFFVLQFIVSPARRAMRGGRSSGFPWTVGVLLLVVSADFLLSADAPQYIYVLAAVAFSAHQYRPLSGDEPA